MLPALVHTLSPFCPEGNCPLSMVAPDFALWELFLDYPKLSHTSEVGFGENPPHLGGIQLSQLTSDGGVLGTQVFLLGLNNHRILQSRLLASPG